MPMQALLNTSVFNPEQTKVISEAFDSAWLMVQKSGVPYANGTEALQREKLAKRMLHSAKQGVLDRSKLADDGVEHILKQTAHA